MMSHHLVSPSSWPFVPTGDEVHRGSNSRQPSCVDSHPILSEADPLLVIIPYAEMLNARTCSCTPVYGSQQPEQIRTRASLNREMDVWDSTRPAMTHGPGHRCRVAPNVHSRLSGRSLDWARAFCVAGRLVPYSVFHFRRTAVRIDLSNTTHDLFHIWRD